MLSLTPNFSQSHLVRCILATRLVTPAQEYQLNQALWNSELTPADRQILAKLLQGLVNGQIIVLRELGHRQTLAETSFLTTPRDPSHEPAIALT
ncbi:hypothetical protein RIF25_01395 [Thermosynechococcaceae cyanobacterium BACA0444]|uniref:Uncharacterized protein n=1 Tax=Pseudocalidococcus azoricus BACA0444 TaxID=2918990 RepID=A0AAE4JY80_9CYAN|nr:hypothetical protein [Pseudocalidococcus azoricus]MDS3859452.1 hypothetical protein [Pseudocalidococcus azoricus BACA0444]